MSLLLLAGGAWIALNILAVGLIALAHRNAASSKPPLRAREMWAIVSQVLLLTGSVYIAIRSSDAEDWQPVALVGLLATLAIGTDVLSLQGRSMRFAGSFLGIVLAMALLGPAPAVAIALACMLVDALLGRPRYPLANLATYAAFPLVGGLILESVQQLDPAQVTYAAAVFIVFFVANLVNFLLIAAYLAVLEDRSITTMARTDLLPLLPWEVATAFITSLTVLAYETYGTSAVALFTFALAVYQLLLKAVIEREQRGAQLEQRVEQLAARHEGMLGLVLQAQSLRDPTAARHGAATARYALELAKAAGLGEREQALVHTAGLLHDIGKEAFPDSILVAERDLTPDDRRLVERHPLESARLIRCVPGLEPVAEVVAAHHERPDGKGYPAGLRGAEIPLLARILAVAEVYDVITAEDSYRTPLPPGAAAEELRRVAGTQLDHRIVTLFLDHVVASAPISRATLDVQAELRLERDARPLFDAAPVTH